jgi:hypothetical protein
VSKDIAYSNARQTGERPLPGHPLAIRSKGLL